jgi:hypothetical protein
MADHPAGFHAFSDVGSTTHWSIHLTDINNHQPGQLIQQARLESIELDADALLLLDVDFKWLMSGHGWWIDTPRIRQDPSYATHCLDYAMTSTSIALFNCATKLRRAIYLTSLANEAA